MNVMSQNNALNLIEMLRCPVTLSKLTLATADEVEVLNQQIASGKVQNRIGQIVSESVESGYFNEDRSLLLPIREGIIILVTDQAIVMAAGE